MCVSNINNILKKSFFRVKEEDQGMVNHSFALFKKSNKEQFALFALLKRATRANHSFTLYHKSNQERFPLYAFLRRATRANRSVALYKKSNKERITLLLFTKRQTKSESLFCSLLRE